MTMTFTNAPASFTTHTTVAFQALFQGAPVTCEVSDLALQDHFGVASSLGSDLLMGFESNRTQIQRVAAMKLPQRIAQGLRPLLSSSDNEAGRHRAVER